MPTTLRRIRRVSCVLESRPPEGTKGKIITEHDLEACLRDYSLVVPCKFWAILHDNDFNFDGVLERPHFHIVLETKNKKTITGFIHDLADTFLIDPNRISVRETRNIIASIRYLMHMDDVEKTPYLPFDVITNNQSGLIEAISRPYDELTAEDLIKIVEESPDKLSLIRRVGLTNYQRYGRTIEVIAAEKHKF